MSLLAPLYLLGTLAISLPILFHLIRRTPHGRQAFSSLMFLSPSPPRITRRSRIEHWLLLLLRAAALLLLAFAFARPFLRESAMLMGEGAAGQRVAVLIDTSASMRRGDLWQQAMATAERVIGKTSVADEVAVFAFDDSLRVVADWGEPLSDPAARRERLQKGLKELRPSWGASDLGRALMTVADRMSYAAGEKKTGRVNQLVLISDMQRGADTAALQAYQWPSEVSLQIETIHAKSPDNAGVRLLRDDQSHGWRVRVANAAGAKAEQFRVAWGSDAPVQKEKTDSQTEVEIYVPAGQSRIIKMSDPPTNANRVRVSGDEYSFDNEYFFSPIVKQEVHVGFVGEDKSDDPHGLRYFLERVWSETPRRKVVIDDEAIETKEVPSAEKLPLVVISSASTPAKVEAWQQYVRNGGTTLLIVSEPSVAASLVNFAPGVKKVDEAPKKKQDPDGYALLGEIKFDHPIFASFAGPKYNDFTKVRIWKHQRFAIDATAQADVLARFDNGDPAIWEQPLGKGRVLWLACGWRPSDSQLALSSKFVPLLSSVLDHAAKADSSMIQGHVHQSVTIPIRAESAALLVTKPDGNVTPLSAGVASFGETDQPGIYRLQQGTTNLAFAVNLAANESDTALMAADHLQQLGVRVGREQSSSERLERQRQMRDIELESRQKLWKWMLVGVLGLLLVETTLASRIAKAVTAQQ